MAAPATSAVGGPLRVVVISPERTLFDGEAEMVVAPAWDGEIGILRGHAPLMALLGSGEMRVKQGGVVERFHVEGGFLQVVDNAVTVLSEKASQTGNKEPGTGNR
jgi:F-type H+-transporting ATPase subunit epsilon